LGIPEHRLPRPALQWDIEYIKALGVEIKTSTPVGPGLSIDDLFTRGYGAVLVTVGAHDGQKLGIPGADLQGVTTGTSFMRDVNFAGRVMVGERVLVIGGGNVAMDCARSARRLGARDVTVASPGGTQRVEWLDDGLHLTGWAEVVWEGRWTR